MHQPHILLVTPAAQGHLNPSLQFAKRLHQMGVHVTLATSVSAHRRISTTVAALGLAFASFSDGYDDGFKMDVHDRERFMSEMRTHGSQTVREIISSSAEDGRPINCVVYTLLLSWAPKVASELHVPSALLWIQAASVLDIFHYYFDGYDEIISTNGRDPNWSIELPGLPLLKARDLPSFILPSNPYNHALKSFKEQIETLNEEKNPKVLVNTFDALEPDALRAVAKLNMIGIGPLIPSAFLDGQDPLDNSFGGDLFEKSIGYMEFLNSKPESSVIYISFGSILVLQDTQLEEIACAILESGKPFLWVIRADDKNEENKAKEKPSFMEELEKQGMIVSWCSQLEVLSHPSLGCFVTHCGWNSMLESLSCGVPTVAFPKWADQAMNAKLIEDVWGSGVKVRANEDGVVESGEISRCVKMVMGGGEKRDKLRMNASKWKVLAREALKEGGSSYKNLKEFVEEL